MPGPYCTNQAFGSKAPCWSRALGPRTCWQRIASSFQRRGSNTLLRNVKAGSQGRSNFAASIRLAQQQPSLWKVSLAPGRASEVTSVRSEERRVGTDTRIECAALRKRPSAVFDGDRFPAHAGPLLHEPGFW